MTKHEPGSLEALAEVIANTVKGVRPLRAVPMTSAPPPRPAGIFDSITRDSIYRRVRWLRDRYGLRFLIDQATFNRTGLEALPDSELSALLRDMERGRECVEEGVSFEDKGLIRDTTGHLSPV